MNGCARPIRSSVFVIRCPSPRAMPIQLPAPSSARVLVLQRLRTPIRLCRATLKSERMNQNQDRFSPSCSAADAWFVAIVHSNASYKLSRSCPNSFNHAPCRCPLSSEFASSASSRKYDKCCAQRLLPQHNRAANKFARRQVRSDL